MDKIKQTHAQKGIKSALLAGSIALTFTPFANISAQQPADPYANGNSVFVGKSAGQTDFQQGIYGGVENGTISSTSIGVGKTANYFESIFGGNNTGTITGTCKMYVDGKTPISWKYAPTNDVSYRTSYYLWGGNRNGGSIGSVDLTIDNGWIYGIVVAGGKSNVLGDVNVTFNKGLIGSLPEYKSGHGEFYAGVEGIGNEVKGNTYLTISGDSYDPNAEDLCKNYTIVRQHVLGGGYLGGCVRGNTYINVQGGSVYGHVVGGGGGGEGIDEAYRGRIYGNTFINMTGGEIGINNPDANGGCLYGGGYSGPNDVYGNTNIYISGTAKIAKDVVGAGQAQVYKIMGITYKPKLFNTVSGNSNIIIENGEIGGNIYAGGSLEGGISNDGQNIRYGATVAGNGTITLRGMKSGNTFAQTFKQSILSGYFSGASSQSTLIFDNYQTDFLGKAGSSASTGLLTNLKFINSSDITIKPADYYAKNWEIESGSNVGINSTGTLQQQETFSNSGSLSFNGGQITLTLAGGYTSFANATLNMSATDNSTKDYLVITSNATKSTGSTTINLNLPSSWEGERIDLIEALNGSNADAFVLNEFSVNGNTVSLRNEVEGNKMFWYIGTGLRGARLSGVQANDFDVIVVPNPISAGNQITVFVESADNEWANTQLNVYSSTGINVYSTAVNGRETTVNMPNSSGTYELNVTTGKGISKTVKVLVK